MKPVGHISTGALLLFLGVVAPTSAQQKTSAQDARSVAQDPPPEASTEQQQAEGLYAGVQPGPSVEHVEQRKMWRQARARSWQAQHHTWKQRGGYTGVRIPDGEFRAYYGREHAFRIHSLPSALVGGRVRFQYGRYWFTLIDPWPEYWPDNWYETDDAYINYYDDGYYLFNESRRGVRVAVEIIPD